jgi:DNA topoisomerase VI subunit A
VGSKAAGADTGLNLPEMKWLGMKSADVAVLSDSATTMSLSTKDRKRAVNLIEGTIVREDEIIEELRDCRDELQRMLMLNKRAEIEILEDRLSPWVEDKISKAPVAV